MTVRIRRSQDRGHIDHGWLDTYHTFSFADYVDPRHVGYRTLRVVNDDRVAPGQGFGTHGHRDMEIVTIVLEGSIEHRDSLGTGSVIRPGDVQRMTAGTGVRHSEMNPSRTDEAHFYQIWIVPERAGLAPGYEQRAFPDSQRRNRLRLVASRDGRDGSLTIHQDAEIRVASLDAGESVEHRLGAGRGAWIQVVKGELKALGETLRAGDGASIEDVPAIDFTATTRAELLLFDLA